MKAKFAVLAVALAGVLFACNKDGYKKGENGLLYKIYTENKGEKIKEGDFIRVNIIYKTDSDSVLMDTYKMKRPYDLIVQKPLFKGDMMDAFKMLTKGDSASFKVIADSVFNPKMGMAMPPFIKSGSYLTFIVKVEDVKTKASMEAEANKAMDKFQADSKIAFQKTASGLRYFISTPAATGTPVKLGDTVKVHYTGKLLDGTKFDSSLDRGQPFELPVQKGMVIDGWVEALQLLKKGESATFIIPAKLAYGEMGNGPIPPNSPLVFDLQIIDVKSKK